MTAWVLGSYDLQGVIVRVDDPVAPGASTSNTPSPDDIADVPALVVTVAVSVWAPSERGVDTVSVNAPVALAVTDPAAMPSAKTFTVLPATAVPAMVGVGVSTISFGGAGQGQRAGLSQERRRPPA